MRILILFILIISTQVIRAQSLLDKNLIRVESNVIEFNETYNILDANNIKIGYIKQSINNNVIKYTLYNNNNNILSYSTLNRVRQDYNNINLSIYDVNGKKIGKLERVNSKYNSIINILDSNDKIYAYSSKIDVLSNELKILYNNGSYVHINTYINKLSYIYEININGNVDRRILIHIILMLSIK